MNTFLNTLRSQDALNRRVFLGGAAGGLGYAALASLMQPQVARAATVTAPAAAKFPNFPPKAKRIIYLFQSGAPSQMDLFDPKPEMEKRRGEDLPESIRQGQRLTTMTSGQKSFPIAPSMFKFQQHGESGMWFSELVPNIARHADRWCMIRSMVTEQINHDPAITFFQTGHQLAGRPSIGSWLGYGLGSDNADAASGGAVPQHGRPSALSGRSGRRRSADAAGHARPDREAECDPLECRWRSRDRRPDEPV